MEADVEVHHPKGWSGLNTAPSASHLIELSFAVKQNNTEALFEAPRGLCSPCRAGKPM
jgi:hypothetical protein